jgi:hypothetical protein
MSFSWFQTSQTGGQQYSDTSPFSIPLLCTIEREMAKDKAGLTRKHQNRLEMIAEGKHSCLLFGDEEKK